MADIDIARWIRDILTGPGSLQALEESEHIVPLGSHDGLVAVWVIGCLANPACEGSAEVLAAITAHRRRMRRLERKERSDARLGYPGQSRRR